MNEPLKWFASNGHLNEEGISLYVDGLKLSRKNDLPAEILRHVQSCQKCKVAIMELFSLLEDHDYSRVGSHPFFGTLPATHREWGLPIYRIAAGFAFLVALGAIAYILGYLTPSPEHQVQDTALHEPRRDTASTVAQKTDGSINSVHRADVSNAYAGLFAPSANLEPLVGNSMRSGATGVVAPRIGSLVRGMIEFRWTTEVRPPFRLEILNNRETVVTSVTLREPRYRLKEILPDGLYYSKLLGGGEILCVGKFLVRSR